MSGTPAEQGRAEHRALTGPSSRGMAVTSQPLATAAAIEILGVGGTAADAAVAAAATLCVVEPRATGIGGDVFALFWGAGADGPLGLDAAGPSAAAATVDAVRGAGHAEMPVTGPWTVTVPGAVDGWAQLLDRAGALGFEQVLQPAIRHAEQGFAVTPVIADEWAMHAGRISGDQAARDVFLPGGRAPRAGEVFVNPELGGLLRLLARDGAGGFYRGAPAERIGDAVERAGGPLRAADLQAWPGAQWVAPLRRSYRDVEHIVLPPPGQGIVALEALGIFEGLAAGDRAEEEHFAIEALKCAFADARDHLGDPLFGDVPVQRLLSPEHVAARRAGIGAEAADVVAPGAPTDTVYLAVVDGDGNACSLIQSLYSGFGSGIGVPGLGITLQNRGKGFVLDDGHPNRLEPGKRPYHTIVPAMLARDGSFAGCLGVVGGFMQPQGQMQIVRHLVDHDLDIAGAVAHPRIRYLDGCDIGAEPGYDPAVLDELRRRGHRVRELSNFGAGGAQAIVRDGDRLHAASDPRKDGSAQTA
ncbi:MAG: gamma-glutamyltranspeptidase / glutathione hydrolase [Baekduia sp.]|nr:gamma-glutamyltranspeptidase / glutathione hydrolase [Baekduia sp.]